MGKLTALFLLLVLVGGAYYLAQNAAVKSYIDKYIGDDVYTTDDSATVKIQVQINGKSGFTKPDGTMLSLYDPATGEELKTYYASYTATITVTPSNATFKTITMTLQVTLRAAASTSTSNVVFNVANVQTHDTSVTAVGELSVLNITLTLRKALNLVNGTMVVFAQTVTVTIDGTLVLPNGEEVAYQRAFKGGEKSYEVLYKGMSVAQDGNDDYKRGWNDGYRDGYNYYWTHKTPLRFTLDDRHQVQVGWSGNGDPYNEGYAEGYIYGYTDAYMDDQQPPPTGGGGQPGHYLPIRLSIIEETNPQTTTLVPAIALAAMGAIAMYVYARKKH